VVQRWRIDNRERDRELHRKYDADARATGKSRGPHPQAKAHMLVFHALRRGELHKPDACEQCGTPDEPNHAGRSRLQGHHDDYSKPLDVLWLCPFCHARAHARMAAAEERMAA
jgi:hypothetical protein